MMVRHVLAESDFVFDGIPSGASDLFPFVEKLSPKERVKLINFIAESLVD
ncbi:MAG: hypothetical protein HC836_38750 [Richelia sp. RM2_1_2]|nr:hypothetical protein [Richelia sp. RM2_1_2]